jgi:uncharacterized protein YkwD
MKRIYACLLLFVLAAANGQSPEAASLEKKVHLLINEQRKKDGLPALEWNSKLSAIAREHSRDMASRDFFSHNNPDDEEPENRAARHGLRLGENCTTIGENIFQIDRVRSIRTTTDSMGNTTRQVNERSLGQIACETVEGWMESRGHRRNILNPAFDREGIGVAITKDGVVYVTQVFIGK